MEIIIRTDGSETVVHPERGTGAGEREYADRRGRRGGARDPRCTRGGARARTTPVQHLRRQGETGVPPVNVTAAEEQVATGDGSGESAGAAPAGD